MAEGVGMTVQELIELLQEQPDLDAPVVLRSVAEQKGDTVVVVVSEFDWREPAEYITFIDY